MKLLNGVPAIMAHCTQLMLIVLSKAAKKQALTSFLSKMFMTQLCSPLGAWQMSKVWGFKTCKNEKSTICAPHGLQSQGHIEWIHADSAE